MTAQAETGGWTKGPWRVADRDYGWDHFAAIITPAGLVGSAHIAALSRTHEETAANARLMAAAPALVEALQKAAERFREYEALHFLKGTQDGLEKAARNLEMAQVCEAALTLACGGTDGC